MECSTVLRRAEARVEGEADGDGGFGGVVIVAKGVGERGFDLEIRGTGE